MTFWPSGAYDMSTPAANNRIHDQPPPHSDELIALYQRCTREDELLEIYSALKESPFNYKLQLRVRHVFAILETIPPLPSFDTPGDHAGSELITRIKRTQELRHKEQKLAERMKADSTPPEPSALQFLDQLLPPVWDFNNDIVIFATNDNESLVQALLDCKQKLLLAVTVLC